MNIQNARTDDHTAKWLTQTRPALSMGRTTTEWLVYYADNLGIVMTRLSERPPFPTNFEDGLDEAERALTDALAKVRKAKRVYKRLPIAAE